MQLLYIMDPMCGWCYGFRPELESFLENHPTAEMDWIMGGLAPDTKEPMDDNLKQTIASYWYEIEKRSQVTFNHDFWQLNTPYRSTYPACRAVIAAEALVEKSAHKMAEAIQAAYYQQAKNPSLEETLVCCASKIGLDEGKFINVFTAAETEQRFQQHLSIAYQLQLSGFPALFYIDDENHAYPLTLGFCQTAELEQRLHDIKSNTAG